MTPNLCQVERIETIGFRILLRHDLHAHFPFGKISLLNTLKQIPLGMFTIFRHDLFRLFVREIGDSLHTTQMEFHPTTFVIFVIKTERMTSETVHVAKILRNPPVTHQDHDLVQSFWWQTPEVPHRRVTSQVCLRIPLLRVNKIGKLQRIPDKENRRVIPDQIPVSLVGIEFHGKSPNIPFRIGCTPLSRYRGETHEHVGFLANPCKNTRFGVTGNVICHRERTKCSAPLGMYDTFWNSLPVKMSQFFD